MGDVILFVSKDNLVVHRVVGIASEGISTRGDNNNDDDPGLVAPEKIVGIVISAWRGQLRRRIYGGRIGQILSVHSMRTAKTTQRMPLISGLFIHSCQTIGLTAFNKAVLQAQDSSVQ